MRSLQARFLCWLVVLNLACIGTPAIAASTSLDALLASDRPPPGVVFEIADRDEAALGHALPWVAAAAKKLRTKFPQLSMAVVSHGREMFALQESARGGNAEAHRLARQLAEEDDIPIHVCGTHAGWRGVVPEDFPKYVDVAPAGPTQVRNYEALGYQLIIVPRAATLKQ